MSEFTTISVKKSTRDRLKGFGLKGSTYDEIVNWLLDRVEYGEFVERQHQRLKEKEKFISLEEL